MYMVCQANWPCGDNAARVVAVHVSMSQYACTVSAQATPLGRAANALLLEALMAAEGVNASNLQVFRPAAAAGLSLHWSRSCTPPTHHKLLTVIQDSIRTP